VRVLAGGIRYTKRQRELMAFLAAYQRTHGVSPTLEEIGQELGVTRVTVFQHVCALEEKGAVRREPLLARSIEILDPEFSARSREDDAPRIPILGRIAAGRPIEAVEDPPSLDLTDLIPTGVDLYALRVQGSSMIEDGIHDGDYVIVESRTTAGNGETVVAILPGEEATLKRFYRESDHVRLEPANPAMQAIRVREIEIRGVVRGVIRTF